MAAHANGYHANERASEQEQCDVLNKLSVSLKEKIGCPCSPQSVHKTLVDKKVNAIGKDSNDSSNF